MRQSGTGDAADTDLRFGYSRPSYAELPQRKSWICAAADFCVPLAIQFCPKKPPQ